MSGFTCDVQLPVTPERVFGVLADLTGLPKRIPGIRRIEVETPEPVGVGTRFRETRVMFGREATERFEITRLTTNRAMKLVCESCGCRYEVDYLLSPDGSGTRLVLSYTITPLTFFARMVGRLMGSKGAEMCRKSMTEDLNALRASLLEERPESGNSLK